jgi:hypothetical protein
MNSLKFWQTVLAFFWIIALLGGGYYFYNSFFGNNDCLLNVQTGTDSCGSADMQNIRQNDFLRYDITSPLGSELFKKDQVDLPMGLR